MKIDTTRSQSKVFWAKMQPEVNMLYIRCISHLLFGLIAALAVQTDCLTAASGQEAGERNSQKRILQAEDYGQWERIETGTALSPDGSWLAVPVSRVNGTSEVQLFRISGEGETTVIPQGVKPVFSEDSLWLACSVVPTEEELESLKEESKPVRNKLALVELSSGETQEFANISGFSFSGSGRYLAFNKYPKEGGVKNGQESNQDEDKVPDSFELGLRILDSNRVVHFGNVSEYAWQEDGDLLALIIEAQDQDGNAIQLFNPDNGSLLVLDSERATYRGLSWRKDSEDLASFRSRKDESRKGETQVILAWRGLGGAPEGFSLDQSEISDFPTDMRISHASGLSWSKDGSRLFFSIQDWPEAPAEDKADEKEDEESGSTEADPEGQAGSGKSGSEEGSKESEETKDSKEPEPKMSDVQIWHSNDERTIPMQEKQKQRDKNRGLLFAWRLGEKNVIRLGTDLMEKVDLLYGEEFATETDRTPYRFDNMFDRSRHDIAIINVDSGERSLAIQEVWYFEGGSATGRYLLYFKEGQYRTYDITQREHFCLTCEVPSSFVDDDYDVPVRKEKPPWGVAGWLEDDEAVLLYDRYDIWAVTPNAGRSVRLTNGTEEQIVHRYLQLDPEELFIDTAYPLYVSMFGYWTKNHGFARIDLSSGVFSPSVDRLVWSPGRVSGLIKSKHAEVYAYRVESFSDSPDYFAGGRDLSDAQPITNTNPFQDEFHWGRSEVIDYENKEGKRLQGALYYPADYKPGQQYPMIVYVYERLSDYVHHYVVPTERRPYNVAVFSSRGYFVLRPDIVYTDRDPGLSALDCVTAAVNKALENESVNRSRIGLVGHSWGGYEASFIPTQTDLFAAAIAGAPITNFFSFYGTFHWGPGMPEAQHFETGQARMEVPFWEDMDAYARNSPVISINRLNTPLMLFFGDADSVVDWHQGVEMYNYARRAGKNLVMLVYPGEDHGARKKENQIDYHRRVLEWFDSYLKGEEAPEWITEGVSALEREKALKESKSRND